jgi:hypothetical protein
MKPHRLHLRALATVAALSATPLIVATVSGCTGDTSAKSDGGRGDAGMDASLLTWFMTCGSPACPTVLPDGGPLSDAGLRDEAGVPCASVGSSCSVLGETCGTRDSFDVNCGAIEVCSDHDPKTNVGGCPISSRRFKDGIEYIEPEQLQRLHDDLVRIRLASYNYKPAYGDSSRKHLGFIIEDNPDSPAVQEGRDRVDVYGYLSMAVAAIQIQEQEIATLREQLDELGAARASACSNR